jgi:hypothetical protein
MSSHRAFLFVLLVILLVLVAYVFACERAHPHAAKIGGAPRPWAAPREARGGGESPLDITQFIVPVESS